MFIHRNSARLKSNANKIANSQLDEEHSKATPHFKSCKLFKQIEVAHYPVFNYFVAILLLVFFAYLIYSVNGGSNSIPNFNQKIWWQYIVALIPLILAILIFIFSQLQYVIIQRDIILFTKSICFGLKLTYCLQKQISQLLNVSILKKGYQKVTMNTTKFYIVFYFQGYEQIQMLGSSSQRNTIQNLQLIQAYLPKNHHTRKMTLKAIQV